MSPQSNEDGSEALMHRSVAAVALLTILIGSLLAAIVTPSIAAAQTAPAAGEVPATTTSTTEAPVPSTTVPPATTVTEPGAPAPAAPAPEAPAAATATVTPPAALRTATAETQGRRGPRSLSEATYVYTPREVKQAWNNSHSQKITLAQGSQLATYLNAVVANQIRQYLLAVYLNAVANSVPNQANWDRVAACESGGNWGINSGNGFYGGLQFTLSTWRSVGGSGYPHQNSRLEQMRRANILKDRAGLGQWPVCGSRFYG